VGYDGGPLASHVRRSGVAFARHLSLIAGQPDHVSTLPELDMHAAGEWLATQITGPVASQEFVQHVEYDGELNRWYVRFGCDGRDATTIYFDLHQRSLRYEVYFLPDPPHNHEALYSWLLKRNHSMYGARFSIGPDGDIYLVGRIPLEHLNEEELDRVIGVLYELVESWFQPAVRIAFAKPDETASANE
jgi:hypothetical protein